MDKIRSFNTGATRDTDEGKLDFEGFLSPQVLQCYAEYMHENRVQSDGGLRASDNWQKGIPVTVYMKSMWRHFFEVWTTVRCLWVYWSTKEPRPRINMKPLRTALCALLFNNMGMLHEVLLMDCDAEEKDQ